MRIFQLPLISLCLFLLAPNLSFSQDVASVAAKSSRDFMFIYPTAFGPGITFMDKTYGTGFGLDPDLVSQLKISDSASRLVDSYGNKLFFGNLLFYPSLVFTLTVPGAAVGLPGLAVIGVPGLAAANLMNGSAYEDLSSSVAIYNGPTDKVVFDIKMFGYKLAWNGGTYDPHDPKILDVLSGDTSVRPLIERYRSKSNDASIIGWTSFLYPAAGYLIGTAANPGGPFGSLAGPLLGAVGAGVGVLSWAISSAVGSSAEADLVQGVKLYDQNH